MGTKGKVWQRFLERFVTILPLRDFTNFAAFGILVQPTAVLIGINQRSLAAKHFGCIFPPSVKFPSLQRQLKFMSQIVRDMHQSEIGCQIFWLHFSFFAVREIAIIACAIHPYYTYTFSHPSARSCSVQTKRQKDKSRRQSK